MNRYIHIIILAGFLFSCGKGKPVTIRPLQLPNGDSIQISDHLQKFYTFLEFNKIYLGPDERLKIDSIPMGTHFYADTAHREVWRNDRRYMVGKYFKDGNWRKGYIQLANLTDQIVYHPLDTNKIFMLGHEEVGDPFNYECLLKLCEMNQLKDSYRFHGNMYPFESYVQLKLMDSLSTGEDLFLHVNFLFEACGSSTNNFVFRYTDHMDSLLYYWTSSVDLYNPAEMLYIKMDEHMVPREIMDGEYTGSVYDASLEKYMDRLPLFIIRTFHEEYAGKPEESDFHIKRIVNYDLIYSFQKDKLFLVDSIPYDSTRFTSYVPSWVEGYQN